MSEPKAMTTDDGGPATKRITRASCFFRGDVCSAADNIFWASQDHYEPDLFVREVAVLLRERLAESRREREEGGER